MMKNHYNATMSTIAVLFLACCAGVAMADELPSDYEDDLYHCKDPTLNQNPIRCDPTTYLWDLGDLNPSEQLDDSLLCQEIVKILVRARAEENLDPGQAQAQETQKEVQLWETIMETSVVDQLEPCVLWAMSFGPLTPYAASMGLYDDREPPPQIANVLDEQIDISEEPDIKPKVESVIEAAESTIDIYDKPADINDNSDPISTMLETEFDPFMIALAWTAPLPETFSLDRTELHDLTGSHMLDALKAELGSDKVAHLDLTVTAGFPDYETQILPLTLSGTVVFSDHREAYGSENLQKLILKTAFVNNNARDLYLFRLKISSDHYLQMVSTVVAGEENIEEYTLPELVRDDGDKKSKADNFVETDLSDEDEGFVSKLLIAILVAVGAAILAVLCFAYFLVCRSRASGKATKTLEEHSSSSGPPSSSYLMVNQNNIKQSFKDGVPAVKTAPTEDVNEDEGNEYDIEYMAGSNDGISDFDMDTLPPPSALPDSDDDQSVVMSVMDGFDDENVEETVAGNTLSDDSASLYSYIPTDTSLSGSLTKEPTNLEKAQKKGILWSVEMQQKAPVDSDMESYEFSTEKSQEEKKTRTSILGPDDNDSQSRDSNSLLYGTDDDDIVDGLLDKQKMNELSLEYDQEESPATDPHPPIVESSSCELESGDKKKKFEDLWKDENEIDEVASVLNYLDSAQSARRAAETEPETEPTSSLKIIDVATPVQTPERPSRPEVNDVQETGEQLLEALVDMVPATNETGDSEDNRMDFPLPATLDTTFQDTSSVSSSLSGSSSKHKHALGESARTKTSNKWNVSSPAASSDNNSVHSTDSSKLRRLLGQGDINDAALVLGEKQLKDDHSASSSNSTSEAEVSISSCTSNKLKSLLTTSDSRDAASDDEPDDFLFNNNNNNNNEASDPRREVEEEKKDSDDYDYDDDDDRKNYLPTNITPRALSPAQMFGPSQADDASVFSALSDAPSVDETIASNMGWF